MERVTCLVKSALSTQILPTIVHSYRSKDFQDARYARSSVFKSFKLILLSIVSSLPKSNGGSRMCLMPNSGAILMLQCSKHLTSLQWLSPQQNSNYPMDDLSLLWLWKWCTEMEKNASEANSKLTKAATGAAPSDRTLLPTLKSQQLWDWWHHPIFRKLTISKFLNKKCTRMLRIPTVVTERWRGAEIARLLHQTSVVVIIEL